MLAQYSIRNGWLHGARVVPSPNFNVRPHTADISLLVVHGISLPPGQFGGQCIHHFFQNRLNSSAHPYFDEISGMKVSAHCLISRLGLVTQFVNFEHRAWHAGRSEFQGEPECNDFSIGIELEGTDSIPYTEAQYRQLSKLALLLQAHYPKIRRDRIVGHSDIAPGRKTDPGEAFQWSHFHALLDAN